MYLFIFEDIIAQSLGENVTLWWRFVNFYLLVHLNLSL